MSTTEQFDKQGTQKVRELLKNNVPRNDIQNIESELKKDFIFAKTKSKTGRKKQRKKKTKSLTGKEKKSLGFYTIPRHSIRYNDILPMNAIWEGYMSEIFVLDKPIPDTTSKSWDTFTQTLYKADFHGSILQVVRSKCPSYVGKIGICIMDTRNTFKIVSKDDVVTTIPKKQCVFEMHLKSLRIQLFGKHICVRPAERSTKKVKTQLHPDL